MGSAHRAAQSVPEMTPPRPSPTSTLGSRGPTSTGHPGPRSRVPGRAGRGPVRRSEPARGYGEQPADSPRQPAGDYDAGEATSYEAAYAEAAYAGGAAGDDEEDVYGVLESGIRDIYGEVRNSLDFHRSQDGGGEVSHVVLSGAAQDIPGFADALQAALGLEVRPREVAAAGNAGDSVSAHRLAVAAGLAVEEVVR